MSTTMSQRMANAFGTADAIDRCLTAAAIWEAGTDSNIAYLADDVKALQALHYFELALAIAELPDQPPARSFHFEEEDPS